MNWLDNILRRFPVWRKWHGIPEPRPLTPTERELYRLAAEEFGKQLSFTKLQKMPKSCGPIRIRVPNQYTK